MATIFTILIYYTHTQTPTACVELKHFLKSFSACLNSGSGPRRKMIRQAEKKTTTAIGYWPFKAFDIFSGHKPFGKHSRKNTATFFIPSSLAPLLSVLYLRACVCVCVCVCVIMSRIEVVNNSFDGCSADRARGPSATQSARTAVAAARMARIPMHKRRIHHVLEANHARRRLLRLERSSLVLLPRLYRRVVRGQGFCRRDDGFYGDVIRPAVRTIIRRWVWCLLRCSRCVRTRVRR